MSFRGYIPFITAAASGLLFGTTAGMVWLMRFELKDYFERAEKKDKILINSMKSIQFDLRRMSYEKTSQIRSDLDIPE
uniref:Uncharacterized protein n=1 Tax=Panagrolaimus davidi TaxID=227884 RepID=A0A914QX50_9BILA